MQITALLKTFIYLISSSLFMPVLLALSLLTLWILVYSGRFFKSWLERRRIRVRMAETGDALPDLILTQKYDGVLPSAVTGVLKEICSLNGREQRIRIVNLLRDTEQRMWASLDSLKMVIRLGPGLGLIGTLIPMGTGLSSLGQGDLSQLSQDLVVAFTTTVVGMALGLVAYVYFTIQRRWVETDIKNIQLAAELLTRGERE